MTITVKVTNLQLGKPVVGVTVPVLKDNQSWKSGTTGVNGTFSLTYTADTWGLVMFSANNSNMQITVKGCKTTFLANGFVLKYNDEFCQLSITALTSFPTSFTSFGYSLPNELRPRGNVVSPSGINADCLVMITSSGDIQRRSMTGSHTTQNANCTLTWHY